MGYCRDKQKSYKIILDVRSKQNWKILAKNKADRKVKSFV